MVTSFEVNCHLTEDNDNRAVKQDTVVNLEINANVCNSQRYGDKKFCDPHEKGRAEYASFCDHGPVDEGMF